MSTGKTFDAEGVCLRWARTYPDLVGRSMPLAGVHLGDGRSPQAGAIAVLRVGDSTVDQEGAGHSAPITWEVKANGGQDGARRQAFRGAQALAEALRTLTGRPVFVEADGVVVKIQQCHTVQGPLYAGVFGGETTYRVSCVFVLQDA